MSAKSALVLFSGGQDSTISLAWALDRYDTVETVGFHYRQRHDIEMSCRLVIRQKLRSVLPRLADRLGQDHVLKLDAFGQISDTAMTRDQAITIAENGLPSTFVPGRNLLFFIYASALAYRRGLDVLVGGMCETDFSGYPDCRNATLQALADVIRMGTGTEQRIETPLMWCDKADAWALARDIGGDAFVDLIIEESHSCYLGERGQRHAWGYGCGSCPACVLRREGYERFKAADSKAPTSPMRELREVFEEQSS